MALPNEVRRPKGKWAIGSGVGRAGSGGILFFRITGLPQLFGAENVEMGHNLMLFELSYLLQKLTYWDNFCLQNTCFVREILLVPFFFQKKIFWYPLNPVWKKQIFDFSKNVKFWKFIFH